MSCYDSLFHCLLLSKLENKTCVKASIIILSGNFLPWSLLQCLIYHTHKPGSKITKITF